MPKREYAPGESRGKTEEARKLRNAQTIAWDNENTRKITLKLNRNTDKDLLDLLDRYKEVEGKGAQTVIKELMRLGIEYLEKSNPLL